MKALSIKQPYAGLIMAGLKNIENRTWLVKYRGALAIVSTKVPSEPAYWRKARNLCARLGLAFPESLCEIDGAVLGVVELTGLVGYDERGKVAIDHEDPASIKLDWWNRDGFGFILENPRRLYHPIKIRGALGLYNLEEETARKIATELQL